MTYGYSPRKASKESWKVSRGEKKETRGICIYICHVHIEHLTEGSFPMRKRYNLSQKQYHCPYIERIQDRKSVV